MTIHWADIDDDGSVVSWGSCAEQDMHHQAPPAPNLTRVNRPENVTGFEPWRFKDGTWKMEQPQ